jgi:hypothetical protein
MNLKTCIADYLHYTFTKVPEDRFDIFTVTHIKKREVSQINHYYPRWQAWKEEVQHYHPLG